MAVQELLTEKQINVLREYLLQSWKILINYGGVRAGKTFINNIVFLFELQRTARLAKSLNDPAPQYILAGASDKTIDNNVLSEIESTFGLTFTSDKHNSLHVRFPGLPEIKVVKAYTGSIAGVKGIKGMTAYGAYINEASEAVQAVFEQILRRCSMSGARVICDTNPDIPTHWLKTNYIDSDSEYIISNHFTIFDNDKLDPEYVKSTVETTPKGMFYDRDILGLWVSGEGLVYPDYSQENNVLTKAEFNKKYTKLQQRNLRYIAGVDWGYEHKGVIVVIAVDNKGNYTLVEEHTHRHWQTSQWVHVAKGIVERYGNIQFYCDSARPEYVAMFQRAKLRAVNANKRILLGVQTLGGLIKVGKFKVVQEAIHYFEKELYQYVWNEKTGEPLKADGNDDVVDAVRYAVFSDYAQRDVQKGNVEQSAAQKAAIARRLGLL